jgi:hypothetical protein
MRGEAMSITAEGEFAVADVLRGLLFLSSVRLFTILFLAISLLFGNVYMNHARAASWSEQMPTLVGVGVVCAIFAAQIYYRSYQMKAGPGLLGVLRYHFDEWGTRITGPHSEAEMRWPEIVKWRESGTTLFIYPNPRIANMVPNRFFSSDQDVAAVQNLLRTHVFSKKR